MRRNIDYKGLTRLPSDHTSFDGEMEEVFNLVNVNGELRPYVTPDQIGTLSGRLVFIHKNEGWEHFITLDGANIKAYTHDEATGTFTEIGTIVNIYGEEFKQVEQVGNTLIILTNLEMKYALWKDGNYKYLGTQIPFPIIKTELAEKSWESFTPRDMEAYANVLEKMSGNRTDYDPVEAAAFFDEYWAYVNTNEANLISNGYIVHPMIIRYAVRLYDGNVIRHSMPMLLNTIDWDLWAIFMELSDSNMLTGHTRKARIKISWSATDLSKWEDIIESVDIYVSEPLFTYQTDHNLSLHTLVSGDGDYPPGVALPTKRIQPYSVMSLEEKILGTGNFYLIDSVSIKELSKADSKIIDTRSINTIATGERMPDEYRSHDMLTANSIFSYNNRLHLAGLNRNPFAGFKLAGMTTYYDGAKSTAAIDVGEQYYLYYPGRSSSVTLSKQVSGGYREKTLPLTPHPFMSGSYYISKNLRYPISVEDGSVTSSTSIPSLIAQEKGKIGLSDANKMAVSEGSNPFVFPASGIVTLPVGKIIAVASNTQAISAGQFGQFPLYLFTDDGIWAMEVSTDGRYMTRQPVSREVAINRNILQMDRHIAFISKKGLMILSGTETECISDIIREVNTRSSKLGITSLINALDKSELQNIYNTVTIEEYMKDAELAHEYLNGGGRIYLINRSYPYSYMFDIRSKSWSKVAGRYRNSTNNYPDCYVQNTGGDIFNLASLREETGEITAMYISRPIRSGDELFSLTQVYQTGIFRRNKLATCIYASRDGLSYQAIASSINQLLLIKGSPYKYYKIVAIADLMANESLSYVTIDTSLKYTNRIR